MRSILIFLFIYSISTISLAQPNYSIDPYNVVEGEKTKKYIKRAKKFIKSADYNKAAMNAAFALRLAVKKAEFSSAQDYLNASYNQAIKTNLTRIKTLEENIETFEGDQTVTDAANIVRLYNTMEACNSILKEIPKKSFKPVKKKSSGFNPVIEDYKGQLDLATKKLEKKKELAAEKHYADGRKFEKEGGKINSKFAAKRYRWSFEYIPNYRDAVERYEEAKKLGTTRMGIAEFESSGSQYNDIGAIMSDALLGHLSQKASELEFFEVLDRSRVDVLLSNQKKNLINERTAADFVDAKGVDILLVGTITKGIVDEQELSPVEKNYSREITVGKEKYIDADGKEKKRKIKKTVTAKAQVHEKSVDVTVACSYKVIDLRTGTMLFSGNSSGEENWSKRWIGSYTGNKKALPLLMRKREPSNPDYYKMIVKSSNEASKPIYEELLEFATKVGN